MDRRTFCKSTGAIGATIGTAGCLGVLGDGGAEGTVLGPPEQDLSEAVHPSYGDEMPHFTVPDPITSEEISISEYEGERAILWTSFYTNCPDGVCPALILRLRRAQEAASEEGYSDRIMSLAITFDPERDTAETLHEYAGQQGVNLDASNWHFLRPESYERGRELLDEKFGLVIEKISADEHDDEHENDGHDDEHDDEHGTLEYQFPHYGLILLANKQGIVERAYPRGPETDIERLVNDVERVATE